MTPYYEDGSVTIYNADCRDMLPELPAADVCITDPPYQSLDVPIAIGGTTVRLARRDELGGKRLASKERGSWFKTLPAQEIARILGFTKVRPDGAAYVFADVKSGLELFPLLSPANVLVWDKGKLGMGYNWRRMHEWIAFCPGPTHQLRDASLGDIVRARGVSDKQHATEKPLDVLRPLLENSSDVGATVLDPFCGSGSTLMAAKSLGRRSVGIEIDERYCEIAAERCRQEVLNLGGAA